MARLGLCLQDGPSHLRRHVCWPCQHFQSYAWTWTSHSHTGHMQRWERCPLFAYSASSINARTSWFDNSRKLEYHAVSLGILSSACDCPISHPRLWHQATRGHSEQPWILPPSPGSHAAQDHGLGLDGYPMLILYRGKPCLCRMKSFQCLQALCDLMLGLYIAIANPLITST